MIRPQEKSDPTLSPTQTGRGRILIVDDEEVLASTMEEFLTGEGFEVGVASDAPVGARPRRTARARPGALRRARCLASTVSPSSTGS